MIHAVPAPQCDWERLTPFLANFAERSHKRWTVGDLRAAIETREMQVWVANDWQAVVLTEVGTDHVSITHGAGARRHEWEADMDEAITDWARDMGKSRVFAVTRPGWAGLARSRGYRCIHHEFVREIA